MIASLLLWLIFSPIAALMAYLITYEEYRHHFPDARQAARHSLPTGILTLVVFLLLGLAATALMPWIVR